MHRSKSIKNLFLNLNIPYHITEIILDFEKKKKLEDSRKYWISIISNKNKKKYALLKLHLFLNEILNINGNIDRLKFNKKLLYCKIPNDFKCSEVILSP